MLGIANQQYDAFTHSFWNTCPNIYSGLQSKWKEKNKTETLRIQTLRRLKFSTLFLAGHTGNYLRKRENRFNSVIKKMEEMLKSLVVQITPKNYTKNEAEPDKNWHIIIMKHVHMLGPALQCMQVNWSGLILHNSSHQLTSAFNCICLPCMCKS